MAHSLRLKVVAEGVETEGQLARLMANRCDEIQGYYFSRPLPPDALAALLQSGRTLPQHLLHCEHRRRSVLLVDEDANVRAALQRLLRRDGYEILCADSAESGLALLGRHRIDLIIADQRMPGLSGVEFLRRARAMCPDTLRIVLAGYTELHSIIEAINEGAVYKLLTKPWDDEQLRIHLAEAFQHKELGDENRRLSIAVQLANRELEEANERLRQLLEDSEQRVARERTALGVMHEVIELLPWPLLGVDEARTIVLLNAHAERLAGLPGTLLGQSASAVLPPATLDALLAAPPATLALQVGGQAYRARAHRLGQDCAGHGWVILLQPTEEHADAA